MKKAIIFSILLIILIFIEFVYYKQNNDTSYIVHISASNSEYINEGFGFVYKEENNKYYIVTNNHVISNSNSIKVLNNEGKKIDAKLIGYDEYFDIAILSVENINLNVPKFNNKYKEKDEIFVLGSISNNYFIGRKKGTIINKKKNINVYNSHFDAIEIKIDVESGYSGSPLINKNNEVIGMISLKEKDNAYALPIDFVLDICKKLEKGPLIKVNMGAKFTNTTNKSIIDSLNINISNINGVLIFDLLNDYPLYNAGIKNYSIITKFNNKDINNVNDLREELYELSIGDLVNLECYIDGEYKTYQVLLNK